MLSPNPTTDGQVSAAAPEQKSATPAQTTARAPLRPDRELVRSLVSSGGEAMRQCMQCATCSSVCGLSSDDKPFPRKEMLWAQWGLKERLMADPDLWLCHECHECTQRCPRGARPGDVMAALRRECIAHYGAPASLSRAASRPTGLLLFIGLAAALLYAGSVFWQSSGMAAKELVATGERIVIPFWVELPHGLLMTLFGAVLAFDGLVLGLGVMRFWRAMGHHASAGASRTVTPWGGSLGGALRRIIWHDDFAECKSEVRRQTNHSLVLYGMLGLLLVDLWVIAARFNPMRSGLLLRDYFLRGVTSKDNLHEGSEL